MSVLGERIQRAAMVSYGIRHKKASAYSLTRWKMEISAAKRRRSIRWRLNSNQTRILERGLVAHRYRKAFRYVVDSLHNPLV